MSERLPFWTPQLTGEERRFIGEVLDSNYLNEGDLTARFENEIAALLGVKHVVTTTSGTAAIFLALVAAGVRAGDQVIVPDVTFVATANAVKLAGAEPVLVDVDPVTLNIAPEAIERAITLRTRAVVPVHVTGRPADLHAILDVADRHGLPVVEDAAEAFMSKYQGRPCGTWGRAGCFSLSPNKTITTGQGGFIATNDDTVYGRLHELKDQGRRGRGTGGDDIHHSVGFNFKFTNLQAAVGLGQLPDLGRRLGRMRAIYSGYAAGLRGVDGCSVFACRLDEGETPQWTDVLVERRNELFDYLAANQMMGRRFWHPLHTQASYRQPDARFPNSTRLVPRALWLPSAFTMSDEDVARVCERIRTFLRSAKQASVL